MTYHRFPSRDRQGRDRGVTLVELIVTMSLIGLIAAVLAASVSVVFRTEKPVNAIIGESHDVQQAVNYFHLDVESGPKLAADWATAPAAGSGCAAAGIDNVMSFDVEDEVGAPLRRIAYRLTTTGSSARLDRIECTAWNGASWDGQRSLNIADRLDASGGPAVVVNVIAAGAEVDRVTMEFAQTISGEVFSATPRSELGLAVGPPPADCGDDPLEAALGFGVFVEGDVDIQFGPVTGSLAAGDALSWEGSIGIATADTNNIAGFTTVAVYANSIDWSAIANPASILSTLPGGANNNVVLGPPYHVVAGNPKNVYQNSSATGPVIRTRGTIYAVGAPYSVTYPVQFEELRDCSDVLAQLPAGADAEFITPENATGGPYAGGPLYLDFGGSRTQVLNLFEYQLGSLTTVNKTSGSPLGNVRPLVVNIAEDPTDGDNDLVWDFTTASWQNVGDAKFVLYNFANTTGTLTVAQDVYGTIFAPYADVVTQGTVQGNVIAKTWVHEGDAVNGSGSYSIVQNDTSKMFAGTINWD